MEGEIGEHAGRLSDWLTIVRTVATTSGGVEAFLEDGCNPLVASYTRLKLGALSGHARHALDTWAKGHGDPAAASQHLLHATAELTDLIEVAGPHPIMPLLQLGADAISAVGFDLLEAGGYFGMDIETPEEQF